MIIYIDSEFKCHTTNPYGTFREVETDFFYDKCTSFIEGYRFIPSGESWTHPDGIVFYGKMITPWKSYGELNAAQHKYEKQLLVEQASTIAELDALVLTLQYNSLMEDL